MKPPGKPQQEDAFKKALHSLSISAESMEEGLLVLDHAGRVVLMNTALKEIFEFDETPENVFFDEVFTVEWGAAGSAESIVYSEDFYREIKHMFGPVSTEITVSRYGTKEFYYLFTLVEYFGDSKMTLCFLKNIAELSSFSSALAQTRTVLERTVQEQNYELMRINAQLRIENSERNAVVQALRCAEARYREIFDNAAEGIFQWSPDWKLLAANASLAQMLGYRSVQALKEDFAEIPFEFCFSGEVAANLLSRLERNGHVRNFELQVVSRDGAPLWANMNARRVAAHGELTSYYEAFIENIADRKNTEEKLLYQAFHDQLTGLANRALFLDRLNMSMRRAHRHPGYKFSVLYLDLDRFKVVNDIFGHATGDELLCKAAQCILDCVREVDTVARFGGDEFAVLIEDTHKPSMAVRVAKRIHSSLKEPFLINGQEVSVGASIGIVLNCVDYSFAEDLLRDADSAMYHVKSNQNLFMRVFSQKMRVDTLASIALEGDLHNAVKSKEFFMVYQPIVYIGDNSLHGYEALIRWKHKGKVVSPGVFIPVAEEIGLIKHLGLFAIENVCESVVEWTKTEVNPFAVHVNISGKHLAMPGFSHDVMKILERTGVDPGYIHFEITESVLLDNSRACLDSIRQVRELGVKFCLDDFGTGFSSLSYLRRLPLDSIKLDRSFVSEVENDKQSVAIVRNLIRLCEDLNLPVVVEGIERPAQVDILSEAGCRLAQGYYFYVPLSEERATDLLRKKR